MEGSIYVRITAEVRVSHPVSPNRNVEEKTGKESCFVWQRQPREIC